ncbi:cyclic nucleotide-binding domain-containing protein, partial [Candidatus Latescibacterota bacterium]
NFICREGENSIDLYILLKGKLKVTIRGTTLLNYITPVGLVGEIGVFTDVQRSATVAATSDSTVIKINKVELLKLIESDSKLGSRLFLNVISDLANKLQEDNETIENLRNKKRTRIL